MTHDYAAIIKDWPSSSADVIEWYIRNHKTIRHALKIADGLQKMQREGPSEGMLNAAVKSRAMDYFYDMGPDVNNRPKACFNAMITEFLKEVG